MITVNDSLSKTVFLITSLEEISAWESLSRRKTTSELGSLVATQPNTEFDPVEAIRYHNHYTCSRDVTLLPLPNHDVTLVVVDNHQTLSNYYVVI